MNIPLIVLLFLVLIPIAMLLYQGVGRFITSYKLGRSSLQVTLLGMPIFKVAYSNIENIEVSPKKNIFVFRNFWGMVFMHNRVFGHPVLVKQKTGMIKWLLITPSNPSEFLNDIKEKISEQNNTRAG